MFLEINPISDQSAGSTAMLTARGSEILCGGSAGCGSRRTADWRTRDSRDDQFLLLLTETQAGQLPRSIGGGLPRFVRFALLVHPGNTHFSDWS